MTYKTNQIGNSLTLTGEGEHLGTYVTVPLSALDGKSEAIKTAYLAKVFAETHLQRVRQDEGIGSKQP